MSRNLLAQLFNMDFNCYSRLEAYSTETANGSIAVADRTTTGKAL